MERNVYFCEYYDKRIYSLCKIGIGMKKLLIMLALASVSVAGMAQDNESEVPQMKHSVATNSFWSNWFLQANLAGSAFYSNEEMESGFSKSPFKGFRNNLGFSVAIGKWFTPGIGLRTKFQGIGGRTVVSEDKDLNANKYWVLNEQVLFNLSNMIFGYNPTRVWNFVPYMGAGFGRNMSYNSYDMNFGLGILNTFRLSRKVAINLDLSWYCFEPGFDGVPAMMPNVDGFVKKRDNMVNVEVGLTYNLGKATWEKTPDVDALKALSQGQIDALNAQLADAQSENDRLKDMLSKQKSVQETKVVKEVVAAPVSVFFNIGKSKIASKKDLQNVKDLAEVAKANNSKIVVTGYADSQTGSASWNKTLSQKRAETVADELVNMGISRDNIEIVAAGGVDTLSPVSYNRRATVAIK